MIKHHYKDYMSQYVAYSSGEFIDSSAGEFPVMLIAEDDGWAYAGMHCKCQQTKIPGPFRSRERNFQGATGPGSESARERIGQGANWQRSYWPIRSWKRIGVGAKRL